MQASQTQQQNNKDFNQLVFFDWDDTLCCSSYLSSFGYDLDSKRPFPEPLHSQLLRIDDLSCKILQQAVEIMGKDDVYIITNAEEKWVDMSAKVFLPKTGKYIAEIGCKVISARCLFELSHPSAPSRWKFLTFRSLFNPNNFDPLTLEKRGLNLISQDFRQQMSTANTNTHKHIKKTNCLTGGAAPGVRKCICSFGDSQAERMAAHNVTGEQADSFYKTIKFMDHPNPDQLFYQLSVVHQNLKLILEHPEQIDQMLVISEQYA